jgi:hypothetical protein
MGEVDRLEFSWLCVVRAACRFAFTSCCASSLVSGAPHGAITARRFNRPSAYTGTGHLRHQRAPSGREGRVELLARASDFATRSLEHASGSPPYFFSSLSSAGAGAPLSMHSSPLSFCRIAICSAALSL